MHHEENYSYEQQQMNEAARDVKSCEPTNQATSDCSGKSWIREPADMRSMSMATSMPRLARKSLILEATAASS